MGSPPLRMPLRQGWEDAGDAQTEVSWSAVRGVCTVTPRELIPACSWPEKGQRGNRQVVEKKKK